MMKPKAHVSIDLETLSTSPAATILSIGAVAVCETQGNEIAFYTVCSLESQPHRHVSQSTLNWWESQSDQAREVLDQAKSANAPSLDEALDAFTQWLGDIGETHDIYPWGNGAAFDVAILEHAYKERGPFVPWDFRKVRDMRTLRDLHLRLGVEVNVERAGTHHNALDDARFQARIVMATLKALAPLSTHTEANV